MKKTFTLAEVLAGRGTMLPVFSKAGFTLAEVLITLGIIGVVAAMTIPNLIQKNYEHQTIAKLKETHSILSQAIRMASEEYGELSGWGTLDNEKDSSGIKVTKFMNNIKPFIKIATDCGTYDEEGKCITTGDIYRLNKKLGGIHMQKDIIIINFVY